MEEKKLNDEEIIKALECCVKNDCEKCPYLIKGFDCVISKQAENDFLDLIHRLQDENERLTKTLDVCKEQLYHSCMDKGELQKQVDELKERYLEESKERCEFEQKYKKIQHAHNIGLGAQRSQWEKKLQQAFKDTAREIYSLMVGEYECYIPPEIAKEIVLRYGLEVE